MLSSSRSTAEQDFIAETLTVDFLYRDLHTVSMSSELSFASAPLDKYQQDALRARGKRLSRLKFVEKLIRFIEEEPASPEDSARLPELYASRDEAAKQLELTNDLLGEGSPDDIVRLRDRLLGYTATIAAGPDGEEAVHDIFDQTELIPPVIAQSVQEQIAQLHVAINNYFDPPVEAETGANSVATSIVPNGSSTPTPSEVAGMIRPKVAINKYTFRESLPEKELPDDAPERIINSILSRAPESCHISDIVAAVFGEKVVHPSSYTKLRGVLLILENECMIIHKRGTPFYIHPDHQIQPKRRIRRLSQPGDQSTDPVTLPTLDDKLAGAGIKDSNRPRRRVDSVNTDTARTGVRTRY